MNTANPLLREQGGRRFESCHSDQPHFGGMETAARSASGRQMSLDPLLQASPLIRIHAACAAAALALGAVQLFRKKGDPVHRAIGKTWVRLMAIVALSSFFIWTIRTFWLFSPIHFLSIFVLVMLWRGVTFARRGDIEHHSKTMQYTYFLGLVVTGLLTFIPGRIMYRVAFGQDGATPEKLTIFAAIVVAVAAVGLVLVRWRETTEGKASFAATERVAQRKATSAQVFLFATRSPRVLVSRRSAAEWSPRASVTWIIDQVAVLASALESALSISRSVLTLKPRPEPMTAGSFEYSQWWTSLKAPSSIGRSVP